MPDRDSVLHPYPVVQGLQGWLRCLACGAALVALSGLKMALLVAGVPAAYL